MTQTTEERALEMLIAARQRIAKPENWIKGVSHRPATESPYECWCATGAIQQPARAAINYDILPIGEVLAIEEAYQALAAGLPKRYRRPVFAAGTQVIDFNDSRTTTHKMVLALFDQAIESLQRKYGDAEDL